jgi:hypothetical protein
MALLTDPNAQNDQPAESAKTTHFTESVTDEVAKMTYDQVHDLAIDDPNEFDGKREIVQYIRNRFQEWRNHRSYIRYNQRLNECLRAYKGEYSPEKLLDIRMMGGSDVFARMTTVKCRSVTALLSDIYLGGERSWELSPTPAPTVPVELDESIIQVTLAEAKQAELMGQPAGPDMVRDRIKQLYEAAQEAALSKADEAAREATKQLDDMLQEGGFYSALQEFFVDLPIFPMAIIKGPTVGKVRKVKYTEDGSLEPQDVDILKWRRINPFDFYYDPGVHDIALGDVLEKMRMKRSQLEAMKGLPGVDDDAVDAALSDHDYGLVEYWDEYDNQEAYEENREDPATNTSHMIMTMEFHGRIRGEWLRDFGFSKKQVKDINKEYSVTAFLVGDHLIKVILNPDSSARHPYYVASYEPVPSSVVGSSLTEILSDCQSVANACMRSLVNNMSISSGPMYYVNEDRLSPTTDADNIHPWKRWRFYNDPSGNTEQPITFFQPSSNAQELLSVYEAMMVQADEVSAIPRYMAGQNPKSGAAATASGLSMLMGNASKTLQNVARSIDYKMIKPMLQRMYDMVLLTKVGADLRGDESIVIRGATVAMSREQDRMRQLEFLQLTANPIDMQIIGLQGRASILRSISDELGMDNTSVVPSDDELKRKEQEMQKQQEAMQQQQMAAQAQGSQPAMARNQGSRVQSNQQMQPAGGLGAQGMQSRTS